MNSKKNKLKSCSTTNRRKKSAMTLRLRSWPQIQLRSIRRRGSFIRNQTRLIILMNWLKKKTRPELDTSKISKKSWGKKLNLRYKSKMRMNTSSTCLQRRKPLTKSLKTPNTGGPISMITLAKDARPTRWKWNLSGRCKATSASNETRTSTHLSWRSTFAIMTDSKIS